MRFSLIHVLLHRGLSTLRVVITTGGRIIVLHAATPQPMDAMA